MATVEVCARQGIALRGHRDDTKYLDTDSNPGNFQVLLQFRCSSGDTVLTDHLQKGPKNASYRSKMVQNEVIELLGDMIKDSIVADVKKAKFFTII